MEVAAAGVLQVAEVEMKHLLLEFTELDTRLLDESFVDLLDLFCNGKGAKQRKQQSRYFRIPYPTLCTSWDPQTPKLLKPLPK